MTGPDDEKALTALRDHGADGATVARIVAAGLPVSVALRAVESGGWMARLRRMLRPSAPLSGPERRRLASVADVAAAVAEMEPDAESIRRFWHTPMPWLGGRSPAEAMAAREGPAIVADLVHRVRYGIYS